jgi:hypothetical protein
MSAGLPGLGLGGLFFIFSALLAPFPELWRTLRGRSDLAAWKAIGRQLAQALAMVAAIDLTLRLTYVLLSATGLGDPPAADEGTALPLNLIGITTGLLVLVLCGAKLAELALRVPGGGLPQVPEVLPRVAPLRATSFAAAAAIAWIALLAIGASELSPLQQHRREQIPSAREPDAGAVAQGAVARPRADDQGDPSSTTVSTEAAADRRGAVPVTPGGAAALDGGGEPAGAAPSPAVAVTDAPPPQPPQPAPSAPAAIPEPKGSPTPVPAPEPSAAGGGPPESAGPPEGAPASEGAAPPAPPAAPPAEPPPQAPAKGLRGSQ